MKRKLRYRCHFLIKGVTESHGEIAVDGTAAIHLSEEEAMDALLMKRNFVDAALLGFEKLTIPAKGYVGVRILEVEITQIEKLG